MLFVLLICSCVKKGTVKQQIYAKLQLFGMDKWMNKTYCYYPSAVLFRCIQIVVQRWSDLVKILENNTFSYKGIKILKDGLFSCLL